MWLKLVAVDMGNGKNTELVNLDDVTTIYYRVYKKYSSIYLAFSGERYTFMNFDSACLCKKEFNRLLDEICEALSNGKNLLVFETNYYGEEKQ